MRDQECGNVYPRPCARRTGMTVLGYNEPGCCSARREDDERNVRADITADKDEATCERLLAESGIDVNREISLRIID